MFAQPLVSCLMPTRGRAAFALQAVRYFLAQTYARRELIVVENGSADLADLLPKDPRIRYEAADGWESLGGLRNCACALARGQILAHWDDDDWYGPYRLSRQVAAIRAGRADITALRASIVFDLESWTVWRCGRASHRRLWSMDVAAGTLVFRREVWEELARYPTVSLGEDAAFLAGAVRLGARLQRLEGDGVFVYVRHGSNTSRLRLPQSVTRRGDTPGEKTPFPRSDRQFYASLSVTRVNAAADRRDIARRMSNPVTSALRRPANTQICRGDPTQGRPASRYLATVAPLHTSVGFGELGTAGSLGYDGKDVAIGGVRALRALSTHPPARLMFYLGGRARSFRSSVAINDDVPSGVSHADFAVYADGREVAVARQVESGVPPREVVANLVGAHLLELVVSTTRWEQCHAVWIDPRLDSEPPTYGVDTVVDPLGMATIEVPPTLPPADRCIATVASAGYEALLDDLLGSIFANGCVADARLVVFLLGNSAACDAVVAKYRAIPVRCTPMRRPDRGSKAVLYAIARVIDAKRYLCVDADVLVLGSLDPVFAAIDACPDAHLFACREGNAHRYRNIGHALSDAYGGNLADVTRITVGDGSETGYTLVVNDGVFAGDRAAMLALDGSIRDMPGAVGWLDEAPDIAWRNQAIFNLALARLGKAIELDSAFNVQLHASDVEAEVVLGLPAATWGGKPVRVLHASAAGRHRRPELHRRFSAVADPIVGPGDGDHYAAFLCALRKWSGVHGLAGLAWSFYGSQDGVSARVRDPSTMPTLAFLHYLVRSSGCIRMVETGTARGVSTACLASAVAHRSGGRVVTFDPVVLPERELLWRLLPAPMRMSIDARALDSLAGMRELIAVGELFDGALLDSEHTDEQLSAELQLAAQLVVPHGFILVHDSRWIPEVASALTRFEAVGYPVMRMWSAPSSVAEDAELGLSIVINELRPEIQDAPEAGRPAAWPMPPPARSGA
jgi:predicted O-methyltransferase YrrM